LSTPAIKRIVLVLYEYIEETAGSVKWLLKGLSFLLGNSHGRFLEGWGLVTVFGYSTLTKGNNVKSITALILVFLFSATSHAGVYKLGWDANNFYSKVLECKKSIVFSAASAYVARGLEKKHDEVSLHNEVISMIPTFDAIASSTCFCALNEVAKNITYKESQKGIDYQGYLAIPHCKEAMGNAMQSIKNNPKALKLK